MGFFDKLVGNKEISLSPQAGLVLAAITMVAIDGDVDDDEMAIIRRLDGSGRTDAWDTAVKTWKTKSLDDCVRMVASSLNSEQQLVVLANLIDIAMADGVLAGQEKNLLETYIELFDVDGSDIEKIVEVVSIKNNKSIFE